MTPIHLSEKVLLVRIFLTIFIFIFSLQFETKADDVKDFEIDGMSIGDSLLEYFDKDQIKSAPKLWYPGSDKFYGISFNANDSKNFEGYTFSLKKNDDKYIIYDLGGTKSFPNDLKNCKSLKNSIIDSFEPSDKNFKYREYDYVYKTFGSGKSIAYISSYRSSSGSIRVYCTDWHELDENEKNYTDELNVDLSTIEFLNFLDFEAYK